MATKRVADTQMINRSKSRGLTPAQIEARLLESDDKEDNDLDELYSPEELAEAENEVDLDDLPEPPAPNREHERARSARHLVNCLNAALDENNFDPIQLPTEYKEYSTKVKPEIRTSKEIDWVSHPKDQRGRPGRQPARDIIKGPIGPVGVAKETVEKFAIWKLFFDQRIMAIVVTETSNEIRRVRDSLPPEFVNHPKVTYLKDTNIQEISAVMGLMYFRGGLGQAMHKTETLFSEKYRHPVFSATMGHKWFKFLLSKIRFNDKETRQRRFQNDRFAAIRYTKHIKV